MQTTIEEILKKSDVTTASEWDKSVARFEWEAGYDGGSETATVKDFTASMLAIVPAGTVLPSFAWHELQEAASDAMESVVLELLDTDGIDGRDGDHSPTIRTSVPDDGIQVRFGPHGVEFVIRVQVTGHVSRTLAYYVSMRGPPAIAPR